MTFKQIFILVAILFSCSYCETLADDEVPPSAPSISSQPCKTEMRKRAQLLGSAPLTATFYANPKNAEGWTAYYEWRFTLQHLSGAEESSPYLIRYDENTEVTFKEAGLHKIVCYYAWHTNHATRRPRKSMSGGHASTT